MAAKLNKAQELAGAALENYPANRLNNRERKALQTAEEYTPAVPSNWGTPPTSQDQALDALAASGSTSPYPQQTTTAVYDFSVQGGTVGNHSLGVNLPNKAVVTEVVRDIITTADSVSHTGTIQLGVPTDGFLEQSALTCDGSDMGQASTGGTALPKKTTAVRALSVTIATNNLTAGRIRWFVRYYISE